MIKVTYQINVLGPNEERITLGLIRDSKRNSKNAKFSVGECVCYGYHWHEESVFFYIDVFLSQPLNNKEIRVEAGKKVRKAIV
ncbi:hypothetical protein DXT76_10780 [Halobacillus trueperi]|uniref:Uncharacterized protein n=1 Tax=Halobacillus trueperi TaxID=156205 RepID=A0A3D8VNT2_9BACI|nr:hypothetical protein [Halobacillus trueperi]RDY70861.1 hypothetical protein DXT76_10780 [Halobacillus trueperi]